MIGAFPTNYMCPYCCQVYGTKKALKECENKHELENKRALEDCEDSENTQLCPLCDKPQPDAVGSDVSPQAEVQRLRGLFAALATDPDACAVSREYARAALAVDDRLRATKSVDDSETHSTSDKGEPA